MTGYNSLAVFLFSALALVITGGYGLGAAMLLLGSTVLLWKRPKLALKKGDYLLIGVLFLYFAVNTVNNVIHADPGREYDAPLRFLLAIPALLLLLAYPARPASLWTSLSLGAIGGGIFVGWQGLVEGIERPGGTTNAIQYGNVSMLVGILCLCGLMWASTRRRGWTALLTLGAVFGMFGSLMTGSRGGWIAMPICSYILVRHHADVHGKRYLYVGLLALAALIGVAYAIPQTTIRARTELAIHELQDFSATGNVKSSTGERLEMWRTALAMVPDHPWLGWGRTGFMEHKVVLIREGKISSAIGEYTNSHNDYLDALVKHGIIGLLAQLSLFLVPPLLFARQLTDGRQPAHPYAIAGVLLGTCYIVFGLTTTFLTVNNGVMMLAFMTVILWSQVRQHQRTAI